MAKRRSSRSKRKEPIRRRIPQSRQAADPPTTAGSDVTDRHAVEGWPIDDEIRVRLARPDDIPAVEMLSAAAGVDLDEEVIEAVTTGAVAAALRAGLEGGKDAFVEHLSEQIFANQTGNQAVTLQHATLVLVADHAVRGVVGALVAFPPARVIESLLEHLRRTGADGLRMTQLLYSVVMGMTRIKAIAVDERLRRNGIGGALLLRCWQIFERNGYTIIFGQADDSPDLSRFFRRHGFVMLEPDSGFDPWVVVGVHADVRPDIGQRTFLWRRGHHRQPTVPRPRPRGGRDGPAETGSGSHRPAGQPSSQEQRPLPLISSGTVPLMIAAAEDPRTAPLNLVAAAACQAGRRASAAAHARLHHVVAAALRHLGFHAQIFAAQVTAWREDKPDDALVTVASAVGTRAATDSVAGGHTIVWTKSFGALVDVVTFFDDRVRDLAADGLQELIASPAMLPLASLEPFVAAGAMLAIERGPIRIGWHLFGAVDTPRAHEPDADAIRRGGEVLADAAVDLLLAADCYVDLAPMHTRFPHLRAVMTQRANHLWASAGDR